MGYCGRWIAPGPSRLGVLPLGYADGVPGLLPEGAFVGWRNRKLQIVGAVSMDVMTVDLTGSDAEVGDVVTVLGTAKFMGSAAARSGAEANSAAVGDAAGADGGLNAWMGPSLLDWVHWSGRKPYELLCGWSRRLRLEVTLD